MARAPRSRDMVRAFSRRARASLACTCAVLGFLACSRVEHRASLVYDEPLDRSGSAAASVATHDPSAASAVVPPRMVLHEVTFYGWPDNSPPGAGISEPRIHAHAGGVGTYRDPITFATDLGEYAPGTILYVPFLSRYVVMEDTCAECSDDWSFGRLHIDIWMNSDASHADRVLACENRWTRAWVPVEVNPPPDRPVATSPLFDPTAVACRSTP